MQVFAEKILTLLRHRDYKPLKRSVLAKQLHITDEEFPRFKSALDHLQARGKLIVGPKNLILPPTASNQITGTFRANPRGFGFIVPAQPTEQGDLFVGPYDTHGAMNGDTVLARVVKKGHHGGQARYVGIITQILDRGNSQFVGILQKDRGGWLVQPEGKGYFEPVVVDDVGAKGGKAGDKVVVEVIHYPREGQYARGVISQVLGRAGLYDSEIKSIIAQYGLPEEFSEESRRQGHEAGESYDPAADPGRDDITDRVIITIDPPDAKDFDDAISLHKDKDGNWQLGVHIADVCTFIPMDSPLDKEARHRGNSVYLPGKVIPMLPEVLSNGICSLQPEQKRFAKSVYITYDLQGKVLGREYANSLICSRARLTYQQADRILQGHAEGFTGEVVALLKDMDMLARAIEKRRDANGMLHLDLPETELVLDEKGKVVDAQPADDSYPHTIIEMFMVEANEAVAALLDRFNVPFMRRIHPDPDPGSAKQVGRFVKLCGFKIPRHLDRRAIQDLLGAVKGTPQEYPINLYILRSLQKAEYSPMHIGHFALASTHYCHFTSPIRRYADLLVHRLLQCYLEQRLNLIGLEEVLPEGQLKEIGEHISFTEQQAADAERELKTVLILQMLTEHIGEEMNTVVSGLTNFGVFVQCRKFGIEGMIEPGDLGLDEWKYDPRNQAVVGRYTGKSVHLGQPIRVRIVSVSVPARQLSVAPVEPLVDERHPRRGKKGGKMRYRNRPPRTRR
ncbi:MAG: ribonuclease R [Sedimentisphaerales bacterium]|nr:ribonuclease R [Sedimentisphaerales bacterium]